MTRPFVWGAATAAFQIEGAPDADGRGRSIWDDFQEVPGTVANGDRAVDACRSYEFWERDVELLARLGVDAYRFSVAWPRVVPDGSGDVNEAGLDWYDRFVDALLAEGIEPVVTLYHWDLPSALQARGGWTQRATSEAFARYTEAVVRRLGDRVGTWVTHNEPQVASLVAHAEGVHAPGVRDRRVALQVAHELLVSHGLAVDVLRQHAPDARVGITLDINVITPQDPDDPAHVRAAELLDGQVARWFLDPVHGRGYPDDVLEFVGDDAPTIQPGDLDRIAVATDFLGINHYRRDTVAPAEPGHWAAARTVTRPGWPTTAMGWEILPEGIGQILRRVHDDYGPPSILVTENGAAFDDVPDQDGRVQDDHRIDYLDRYVDEVLAARGDGVPVDGWFLWSLLDNFEWAEGFDKRFGIVRTLSGTPTRVPKASFDWYADRIRQERGQPQA